MTRIAKVIHRQLKALLQTVEAPSFPSSPRISSVKKQKIACDKRERTDTFMRDLSSSTPRHTKRKVVRPKQLSHCKYASKCVQKAKSTFSDFASKNSVPVDMSKDNTADGKDQANVYVLSVLKDISSTLNTLVGRVENSEKEIRSAKSKMAILAVHELLVTAFHLRKYRQKFLILSK